MITVRFPGGCAVQYNTAVQARLDGYGINLFDGTDTERARLVAIIPIASGCLIEFMPPCLVYDALRGGQETAMSREMRGLRRDIRALAKRK